MKWRTKYSDRKRTIIESGSGIKTEYAIRIIDGEETLAPTGKTDFYAYIQSHADSVDLHKILERCAMLDDYGPLMRMPAEFMDTSGMPKTLAEAYAQVKDAENFFERMPTDIKEKYENNFVSFINDIGSDNFTKNVSDFLDTIKPKFPVKEEEAE